MNVKEAGSEAVIDPSIAAVTGIATIALVFRLFTRVVLSHSSHVKKTVEASEKQKEMEDLSTGAPSMMPYLSG